MTYDTYVTLYIPVRHKEIAVLKIANKRSPRILEIAEDRSTNFCQHLGQQTKEAVLKIANKCLPRILRITEDCSISICHLGICGTGVYDIVVYNQVLKRQRPTSTWESSDSVDRQRLADRLVLVVHQQPDHPKASQRGGWCRYKIF